MSAYRYACEKENSHRQSCQRVFAVRHHSNLGPGQIADGRLPVGSDYPGGTVIRSEKEPVNMPFGKHKGTPIELLDDSYLWWLASIELREPLLSAVGDEIVRRGGNTQKQHRQTTGSSGSN